MRKKYSISLMVLGGLLLSFLFAGNASAELFRLKDGRLISGKLDSFTGGSYFVLLADGKRVEIKQNDLASIEIAATDDSKPVAPIAGPDEKNLLSVTKAESPYLSPVTTFRTWRAAAIKGDIKAMTNCYASFKQEEKRKELKKISKSDFEKMKSTTVETIFTPSQPIYQGDRAFLEVNWTKGLSGDSQTLQFILEKNDWKIVQ